MPGKPWRPSKRRRALIQHLCEGDHELGEIAGMLGIDLAALAKLADDAKVLRALDLLRRLEGLRNELLLSRYRGYAVAGLVKVIDEAEDPDLARKAAVDLLKADLTTTVTDPDPSKGSGGASHGDAEPIDAASVLAALGELGTDRAEGPTGVASAPSSEGAS